MNKLQRLLQKRIRHREEPNLESSNLVLRNRMSPLQSNCLRCGKGFEPKGSGKVIKKFCCVDCRLSHNASLIWKRYKNNPEFRAKAVKRLNDWIEKNRERWNIMCREPMKIHAAKLQHYRRENGLCIKCGGKRDAIMHYKNGTKVLLTCIACCNKYYRGKND